MAESRPRIPLAPSALVRFVRVYVALILREMVTRYSSSTGGYLWAIATPVLIIIIMSAVFSMRFRQPSIGFSFIIFYTSGYIPFHMYFDTENSVSGALRLNRQLLQYPMVTPMDAVLARATLSTLTSLVIGVIILAGALQIGKTPVNLDYAKMAIAMASAAMLGVGVGALNGVIAVFAPLWDRLWRVLTTPLMVISGVLFTYDEVPPYLQEYLWYNPIIHAVGYMRSGIYGAYPAPYVSLPYLWTVSGTALLIGLFLVRRHRSEIINPKF